MSSSTRFKKTENGIGALKHGQGSVHPVSFAGISWRFLEEGRRVSTHQETLNDAEYNLFGDPVYTGSPAMTGGEPSSSVTLLQTDGAALSYSVSVRQRAREIEGEMEAVRARIWQDEEDAVRASMAGTAKKKFRDFSRRAMSVSAALGRPASKGGEAEAGAGAAGAASPGSPGSPAGASAGFDADKGRASPRTPRPKRQETFTVAPSMPPLESLQANVDTARASLDAALAAVQALPRGEFVHLRWLTTNPPPAVLVVLQALCVLLGEPFEAVRQVVTDTGLVSRVAAVGPLGASARRKLTPLLADPLFVPAVSGKVCKALQVLCAWARAVGAHAEASHKLKEFKKATQVASSVATGPPRTPPTAQTQQASHHHHHHHNHHNHHHHHHHHHHQNHNSPSQQPLGLGSAPHQTSVALLASATSMADISVDPPEDSEGEAPATAKEMSELEKELRAVEEEASQIDMEVHYTSKELEENQVRALELRALAAAEKTKIEPSLLIWRPAREVRELTGLPESEMAVLLGDMGVDERGRGAEEEATDPRSRRVDALRKVAEEREKSTLDKMKESIERSGSTIGKKPAPRRERPSYGAWYIKPGRWARPDGKAAAEVAGENQIVEEAKQALQKPLLEEWPLTPEEMSFHSTKLFKAFITRSKLHCPQYLADVKN